MTRDLYLEFVKAAKLQDRTVPQWLCLVGRDAARAQIQAAQRLTLTPDNGEK